jgi:hypothetical protein
MIYQKHMAPRPFQSQIMGPKTWSGPTKTGVPYNFCFIMFFRSSMAEEAEAPHIT